MKRPQAVVIGCSAGGLDALKALLSGLDPAFTATVLVCCHSGSETVELLCDLLTRVSPLPVIEASERRPALAATVQVAPSGYHLLIENNRCFSLSVDERVCHARPSIDVMFTTAAEAWRDALVGVVLTGGNADGAAGLRMVREHGGIAIVQSPLTAHVSTMPQAALDIAGADYCIDLEEIPLLLNRLCLP